MSTLNLNQAHVEAICSATYLENYLDCLDALPDELQRILTQIREVDVKLSAELEKDTTPFEDVFVSLKDGETPDSRFVSQLQRMLLRMQEFEDEKIQLSSSLMEFIENRTKQLESDRENLDPSNQGSNDAPSSRGNNSNKRNGGGNDTKNLSTVQSSASAQSIDNSKDNNRHMEHRANANSAKKRKPKMESSVASSKSSVNSKSNQSSTNHHGNSNNSHRDHKDETPAKKHSSTAASQETTKTTAKLITKRKRRSRAGAQAKCQKEVAVDPPEPEEPTYCTCDQVSYGEMIGCDNDACPIEWFHFDCVGLATKPKGKWFCPKCRGDKQTVMRRGADKGR